MAGFLITKSKQDGFLEGKVSKLSPKTNPDKYYPEAGPARREGNLPIKALASFGNQQNSMLLPGPYTPVDPGPPPPPVIDYLTTEVGDQMITEDGNNIILE